MQEVFGLRRGKAVILLLICFTYVTWLNAVNLNNTIYLNLTTSYLHYNISDKFSTNLCELQTGNNNKTLWIFKGVSKEEITKKHILNNLLYSRSDINSRFNQLLNVNKYFPNYIDCIYTFNSQNKKLDVTVVINNPNAIDDSQRCTPLLNGASVSNYGTMSETASVMSLPTTTSNLLTLNYGYGTCANRDYIDYRIPNAVDLYNEITNSLLVCNITIRLTDNTQNSILYYVSPRPDWNVSKNGPDVIIRFKNPAQTAGNFAYEVRGMRTIDSTYPEDVNVTSNLVSVKDSSGNVVQPVADRYRLLPGTYTFTFDLTYRSATNDLANSQITHLLTWYLSSGSAQGITINPPNNNVQLTNGVVKQISYTVTFPNSQNPYSGKLSQGINWISPVQNDITWARTLNVQQTTTSQGNTLMNTLTCVANQPQLKKTERYMPSTIGQNITIEVTPCTRNINYDLVGVKDFETGILIPKQNGVYYLVAGRSYVVNYSFKYVGSRSSVGLNSTLQQTGLGGSGNVIFLDGNKRTFTVNNNTIVYQTWKITAGTTGSYLFELKQDVVDNRADSSCGFLVSGVPERFNATSSMTSGGKIYISYDLKNATHVSGSVYNAVQQQNNKLIDIDKVGDYNFGYNVRLDSSRTFPGCIPEGRVSSVIFNMSAVAVRGVVTPTLRSSGAVLVDQTTRGVSIGAFDLQSSTAGGGIHIKVNLSSAKATSQNAFCDIVLVGTVDDVKKSECAININYDLVGVYNKSNPSQSFYPDSSGVYNLVPGEYILSYNFAYTGSKPSVKFNATLSHLVLQGDGSVTYLDGQKKELVLDSNGNVVKNWAVKVSTQGYLKLNFTQSLQVEQDPSCGYSVSRANHTFAFVGGKIKVLYNLTGVVNSTGGVFTPVNDPATGEKLLDVHREGIYRFDYTLRLSEDTPVACVPGGKLYLNLSLKSAYNLGSIVPNTVSLTNQLITTQSKNFLFPEQQLKDSDNHHGLNATLWLEQNSQQLCPVELVGTKDRVVINASCLNKKEIISLEVRNQTTALNVVKLSDGNYNITDSLANGTKYNVTFKIILTEDSTDDSIQEKVSVKSLILVENVTITPSERIVTLSKNSEAEVSFEVVYNIMSKSKVTDSIQISILPIADVRFACAQEIVNGVQTELKVSGGGGSTPPTYEAITYQCNDIIP